MMDENQVQTTAFCQRSTLLRLYVRNEWPISILQDIMAVEATIGWLSGAGGGTSGRVSFKILSNEPFYGLVECVIR
jgi:hypothetical protein